MILENLRVLVINPASISTKIGVFDNERSIFENTIEHNVAELRMYPNIADQSEFRKQMILEALDREGINLSKFHAVCARGGLLRPIEGGTYLVNEEMLKDLKIGYAGEHASNLGGILAFEIASNLNIPAYIVDPVVVDEMEPIAKISGLPDVERKSIFHALNQKAVARKVAVSFNKDYEQVNLIITHMGGGITVGVHKNGKVIDVNNGLHGDGPFSLERAGGVPAGDLVSLCFSGQFYREEMMKELIGKAGLIGYLKTSSLEEVEKMMDDGDEHAKLIYRAMAYQIGKEIGAASAVLKGIVDAIVLTGSLAFSKRFVKEISSYTDWIADTIVYPGENELQALAEGATRVLRNEEIAKNYPKKLAKANVSN